MTAKQRNCYWAILCLALVLRIAAAVVWHANTSGASTSVDVDQQETVAEKLFRFGDSYSYWVLAESIAQGQAYQYGSENAKIFRTPLFPLLLAPLTLIPQADVAVLAARCVCCLLGTLAVGLLMQMTFRIGSVPSGLLAGAMAAVYPSAIGMSIVVLSEALFMPLMMLHVLKWHDAWSADQRPRSVGQALLAGCFAGLAVLARPSWLLFIPFIGFLGVVLGGSRGRHVLILGCSLAGLVAVMSPWWVRNALVTGHFVPTTLQVGPSLVDSFREDATGASDTGMSFMQSLVDEQLEADQASSRPPESTFEYRLNRRATRAAWNWAGEHPKRVLELAFAKLAKTWSPWPAGSDIASPTIRMAISLGTFTVLPLALVGSWLASRSFSWAVGICWLPCIYFTLLHMVFVGSVRYREPGVFVLIALAGCGVAQLASCLQRSAEPTSSSVSPPIPRRASKPKHSRRVDHF